MSGSAVDLHVSFVAEVYRCDIVMKLHVALSANTQGSPESQYHWPAQQNSWMRYCDEVACCTPCDDADVFNFFHPVSSRQLWKIRAAASAARHNFEWQCSGSASQLCRLILQVQYCNEVTCCALHEQQRVP